MDTKTLTIMFTDISGFTKKTSSQSRTELASMLELHDKLLEPVFERYKGKVIKTIGDAFMVSFDSPTDALLCAMQIQAVIASYNAKAPTGKDIHIKIAVNTGEVSLRGNDLFGEPVNVCSRVQHVVPAGEVYFTESVYHSMKKNEVPHEEIGTKRFKGTDAIKIYKISTGEKKSAPFKMPGIEMPSKKILIGIAAVLILAVGLAILWPSGNPTGGTTTEQPSIPAPEKITTPTKPVVEQPKAEIHYTGAELYNLAQNTSFADWSWMFEKLIQTLRDKSPDTSEANFARKAMGIGLDNKRITQMQMGKYVDDDNKNLRNNMFLFFTERKMYIPGNLIGFFEKEAEYRKDSEIKALLDKLATNQRKEMERAIDLRGI